MGEYDLVTTSDKVVARIQNNEYDAIQLELSGETAVNLIYGFANVVGKVSSDAFQTVSEIYTQAIIQQANLELKHMNKDADEMTWFNDKVEEVMSQLDLKDPQQVDSFEKVINILANSLQIKLSRSRPTLLRLLGWRKK